METSIFSQEYILHPWKEDVAIRFAHKRTYGNPQRHRLHLNDHLEFFFPLTPVDYLAAGQIYHLKKGEVLPIAPHCVHAAVPISGDIYERMYIVMPLDAMQRFSCDPLSKILGSPSLSQPFGMPDSVVSDVFSSLQTAESLCRKSDDGWRDVAAFFHLAEAIRFVSSLVCTEEILCEPTNHLPEVVRQALQYIERNLPDIEGAGEIANAIGFSLPYLSGRFHKIVGVSVTEYLNFRKIALAKQLLEQGTGVTEACYGSGFHDCSYFIRQFRAHTGATPNRYRKNTAKPF